MKNRVGGSRQFQQEVLGIATEEGEKEITRKQLEAICTLGTSFPRLPAVAERPGSPTPGQLRDFKARRGQYRPFCARSVSPWQRRNHCPMLTLSVPSGGKQVFGRGLRLGC